MLIQSFIKQAECEAIRQFALNKINSTNDCVGEKSFFWRLRELPKVIPELVEIRNRCLDLVGKCKQDNVLKDIIAYIYPNGYIKEHNDPPPKGYKHIRANVLIQSAEQGGHLIHDGKVIDWKETDLYLLDADKLHEVTRVLGNKDFLVVSYGFLLPL